MKLTTYILAAAGAGVLYFYLRKPKASNKSVAIVGDSLSLYPGGWQDILRYRYNWLTYNLSKVGQVTATMVEKYQKFNQPHDIVLIYAGANDIGAGIDKKFVYDNIRTLVKLAKEKRATPIIITGYKQVNNTDFQKKYWDYKNNLFSMPGIVVPAISVSRGSVKDNVHMTDPEDHKKLANLISEWALRK